MIGAFLIGIGIGIIIGWCSAYYDFADRGQQRDLEE